MAMHDVEVEIISQKGTCGAGHKEGDEWVIRDHTPGPFNPVIFEITKVPGTARQVGARAWED